MPTLTSAATLAPGPGVRRHSLTVHSPRLETFVATPAAPWTPPQRGAMVAAGTVPPPAPPAPTEPLANFHVVSDTLVRSGWPTREGCQQLKDMGVTTMINVYPSTRREAPDVSGFGFNCIEIPCDAVKGIKDTQVLDFLSIVTNPSSGKSAVHCHRGMHRTGYMVACYRMVVQGWSKDQALEEGVKYGLDGKYPNLLVDLKALDIEALKEKLKTWPMPHLKHVR